ncbi:hypothetical protein BK187_02295 [Brucella melitensis]|uniref:Uncharacterized protein n=5 Tax=Brucella TaxID=234 RepID=A0AAI8H5V5_BRUSS|nr:hypothetical protein BR0422 [Brucella suis 1330]AEU05447.1 hypothetical protein BSVBI22_A0423 [Brucella suis VBI22]AHN46075.1 hypothetical protein BSS2_I0413 [Brucella suis bv. 1 str. S2]APY14922.1 hypothetical protein BKD02_03155 [Brucella sp. 09RB8910]AQQ56781.1 hypothetical protein ADS42_006815 [Brucella melitensis]ASU72760.1 hypothetical protein CJP69_08725 [Brucella abortus]ATQ51528.1 hypothetical protein CS875_02125 [Brucella suis]EEX54678.1 predicted protein [Brucella abortus bv. 4
MKPKPLVELKNFTVPFAILNSFQFARLKYSELPFAADFYEFERNTGGRYPRRNIREQNR